MILYVVISACCGRISSLVKFRWNISMPSLLMNTLFFKSRLVKVGVDNRVCLSASGFLVFHQ